MPKKLTPQGQAASAPAAAPTPAPKPKRAPRAKRSVGTDTNYVRNLHGVKARVTLDSGREIQFEPRGQRGDTHPVNGEEQFDSRFVENIGLIFEVIGQEAAHAVISKQATNQQTSHSAFDQLRDELGRPYERVVITPSFEEQGKTVARIEHEGAQRSQNQREAIVRQGLEPQQVNVPGTQPQPEIPADVTPEQVADWAARNLDDGGLSRLRVSIGEVRHDA